MEAIEDAVRAILMNSVGEALDVEVEYGIRQVERAVDTNKEENAKQRETIEYLSSEVKNATEFGKKYKEEAERLQAFLHLREMHPDYEYRTTEGPRKAWDGEPDLSIERWEENVDLNEGWERFDYTEERYWRRIKAATGVT